MHINIGDKFVATNKIWFVNKGTEVSVTNVDEDGIISFTFGENGTNYGYMDITTFTKNFEKIDDKEEAVVYEITNEYIEEIMENSKFETFTTFNKCTVVSCHLPNGFVITESYYWTNHNDYNSELAEEFCYDKIAEKIYELESYRLQQYLWEEEVREDCECTCESNCAECNYNDKFSSK